MANEAAGRSGRPFAAPWTIYRQRLYCGRPISFVLKLGKTKWLRAGLGEFH